MEGYRVIPDHIIITENKNNIIIDDGDYVVGISIEILSDSDTDALMYGLGESPNVPLRQGEGARGYGGFHCCGVPCYYKGSFNWQFANGGTGRALLIINKLQAETKKV